MSGASRGRIAAIELSRPIQLNRKIITKAKIEIDHINFGLNSKTGALNKKARSKFSVKDIEKFIMQLDKEDLLPTNKRGSVSHFDIRMNCPIPREFHQAEFFLFFDLDSGKPGEIHVITIFRARR